MRGIAYTLPVGIEDLKETIRKGRRAKGCSQALAAELADVELDVWKGLESVGPARRSCIRLPTDMPMMNGVAKVLGWPSGLALLKKHGLLEEEP